MLYQDNYLVVNVKLNFCQRQIHCIDDQDKFQSVADTDNEFTECQTPRKILQYIGISLVSLYASMKAYKVQGDCLKDSYSDYYNENEKETE